MSDDQAWMVPPPIELHAQIDPPAYDSDSDMKKEIYALTQAREQLEQKLILKSFECNRLRLGLCECGRKCRPPSVLCNTCLEANAKQRKHDRKIQHAILLETARRFAQQARKEAIRSSVQNAAARQLAQQMRDDKLHLAIRVAKAQRAAEALRESIYGQPHIPLCECGQARRENNMMCKRCVDHHNNASINAQKLEVDRIMKELRMSKLMLAAAAGACFIPASEREPDMPLEHSPVFTHESI